MRAHLRLLLPLAPDGVQIGTRLVAVREAFVHDHEAGLLRGAER